MAVMTKKADKRSFPKQIFVVWQQSQGFGSFLSVDSSPNATDTGDGERVAIYELKTIKTKRVAHSLEESGVRAKRLPNREAAIRKRAKLARPTAADAVLEDRGP